MPRRDVMTAEKRLKLIEYRDKTNLTAADYKKSQNLMFSGTQVTWDTHVGLIELSAERIIKGAGKRKGARTQNAVMNKQSAPKVGFFSSFLSRLPKTLILSIYNALLLI